MIILLTVWNLCVFILYGVDKLKAKRGSWRIKESTLLIPAFLFGGVGAMFGMVIFNHKTARPKFRALVPLAAMLNVALILMCCVK